MRRRIGIDLDNTLCKGEHWDNEEQCANAEPIKDMVDKVNELFRNEFIIIYTARQNWLMNVTFEWLDKHGIRYHAVSNKKIPLDLLVDDCAFHPGSLWVKQ